MTIEPLIAVVALVLSAGIGAVIAWLATSRRLSSQRAQAERELARVEASAQGLREQVALIRDDAAASLAQSRADAAAALAAERESSARAIEAERKDALRELTQARGDAEARIAELRANQEAAKDQFKSVAAQALETSQNQFLTLAKETLSKSTTENEAALAQREQAIKALVEPLSQSLERVQTQVVAAEKSRAEGTSQLTENLRNLETINTDLRKGTSDLVNALRSSQSRGAWGEMHLRRVVEVAGMVKHVDFVEQASSQDNDGRRQRPDMVVRLAGGRSVIVDSKVPFSAFSEAQNAEDDAARNAKLDEHAKQMRGHVNSLSSKDYVKQFDDAPEFTVLFVPSDVILATAVERDPDLMDYAVSRNVIIATPMTLVALLRTVAYAWRQEALAENAKQVYEVGKELYARLSTMAGHVAKAGKGLRTAVDGYNSMVGSLDRNVMTSARRMVDLELIEENRAIDEPGVVDVEIKSLTKDEFLALDPPTVEVP